MAVSRKLKQVRSDTLPGILSKQPGLAEEGDRRGGKMEVWGKSEPTKERAAVITRLGPSINQRYNGHLPRPDASQHSVSGT